MRWVIFNTVLIIFLSSCATIDSNQVKRSTQVIKGGQSFDKSWKEALNIRRTSWFYKADLLYEINIADIPLDSPFLAWFDKSEISSVKNCKQILWVVDYAYDTRRIQQNYVKNLLSESGYVDIAVPHFSKNFLNHPDTSSLSNRNYKMSLFCHESKRYSGIAATIPGYKQENIEF
jgi:hypothetical protein